MLAVGTSTRCHGWGELPATPLAPRAGMLPEVLQQSTLHAVPSPRMTDTSEVTDGDSRHEITALPRKPG